ncbi:PEBP-like protein [Peniophora sp. CONT]|nr:PEBP-like protein [Peniophora sp. CONT]
MIGYSALLALFAAGLARADDTSLPAVVAAFDKANIPTDAFITFDPSLLLQVQFPQADGSLVNVTAGVQLPRNATVGPPLFNILEANETATGLNAKRLPPIKDGPLDSTDFVVAMVDLDAPTPQDPTSAQIRHFLGSNFTLASPPAGSDLAPLVNSTPALSNFLQPTPPAGSDAHRYVFLLFAQSPEFDDQTLVNSTTSIANFNISSFAAATGLGDPLAGSFILVAPDPSTAT